MIRLLRPSDAAIAASLSAATPRSGAAAGFSYPEVGATARKHGSDEDATGVDVDARRYAIDRRRFVLGQGEPLFARASRALLAWRHFEIPWLVLHGGGDAVRADQIVATATRAFGLCFVNPCRVVYVENEATRPGAVAFAYGTLEGHVARGEERFGVRLDRASDDVVFEIVAFSRPAIWLTRLGRPWMRRIQRRFASDAAAALARASNAPHGRGAASSAARGRSPR